MIQGMILFMFWIILVPAILGMLWIPRHLNEIKTVDVFEFYTMGIIIVFALFELIAVPITFMYGTLMSVTILWAVSCILLILMGGAYRFLKWKDGIKCRFVKNYEKSKWGTAALVLILFQIVYIIFNMHIDDDDAWYVGTAVTSYASNTINRIYPYTGELMNMFPSDYTLSPYPIFYAMLGKLTLIHPAILMHTVMPAVLLALSYMVYYLLVNRLYDGNIKQTAPMMFFIALFNLFGCFSTRSASAFLLFRIWQGKATLCNIFVPLTIYMFMQAVEYKKWKNWLCLGLCVIAATMVSSMGVFLIPVLLGTMSLIVAVVQKNRKQMKYVAACIIPCCVQFFIFYFVLR